MPSISLEYMIMVPVLIAQIFIFPYTASVIMNTWTDSRMTIELGEIAGHVGSSIQQLYYAINHESMSSGSVSVTLDMPPLIEGHAYTTTLTHAKQLDTSCKIMNVTLKLSGTKDETSTLVTLGPNVNWQENLSFLSGAQPIVLKADKTQNSISLTLGGT
jgi:hypothetical protein